MPAFPPPREWEWRTPKRKKGSPNRPNRVTTAATKIHIHDKISLKTGTGREELVKILPNEYFQAGQEGALKKISE